DVFIHGSRSEAVGDGFNVGAPIGARKRWLSDRHRGSSSRDAVDCSGGGEALPEGGCVVNAMWIRRWVEEPLASACGWERGRARFMDGALTDSRDRCLPCCRWIEPKLAVADDLSH